MSTRILFVDRDGTLIAEPPDFQIDRFEKLRFVPGMLPALLELQQAGFELVLVSNQDGLGTERFPQADFDGPHALLLQLLESQGVRLREVLIDPSLPEHNSPNRKPGLGMVMHYLRDRSIDLARSAVVGDRDSDLEFARALGVRGFKLDGDRCDWPAIVTALLAGERCATAERTTRETRVRVRVDLDRGADPVVATGIGFFDHMLEQFGKHGGFALDVHCAGDLQIDEHHTVEDCALTIGQALRQAIGDKRGIARYGAADDDALPQRPQTGVLLPMDDALACAALDWSGRAYFVFDGAFARERVGDLPTELVSHFFRSLCDAAGITLHLRVRGVDTHHQIEACFKAVARAVRAAIVRDGDVLPSTKGAL